MQRRVIGYDVVLKNKEVKGYKLYLSCLHKLFSREFADVGDKKFCRTCNDMRHRPMENITRFFKVGRR